MVQRGKMIQRNYISHDMKTNGCGTVTVMVLGQCQFNRPLSDFFNILVFAVIDKDETYGYRLCL